MCGPLFQLQVIKQNQLSYRIETEYIHGDNILVPAWRTHAHYCSASKEWEFVLLVVCLTEHRRSSIHLTNCDSLVTNSDLWGMSNIWRPLFYRLHFGVASLGDSVMAWCVCLLNTSSPVTRPQNASVSLIDGIIISATILNCKHQLSSSTEQ